MKTPITEKIISGFWEALDWIYPPVCSGCGKPGYRLCADCQEKIEFRIGPRCKICGEKILSNMEICKRCQENPPSFTALRCLADYGGVIRECVHTLKYQKNQSLGEIFSGWLASLVRLEGWSVDLVMPVPLSPERLAERGYNQSASIARPLSAKLGVRYHPYAIKRIRNTRSQVGLSAEERRINVAGAFEAEPDIVCGRKVLVVDDVMTTGSTLESCAEGLKNAGAVEVYCLALAGYKKNDTLTNYGELLV
jgi:ComF family protein